MKDRSVAIASHPSRSVRVGMESKGRQPVDISLGEETLTNVLESLRRNGESMEDDPHVLDGLTVDTSLLLNDHSFQPTTNNVNNASGYKAVTTEHEWQWQRQSYEREIVRLRGIIAKLKGALTLSPEVDEECRAALGKEVFERLYNP